jgi:hypothetical protein
MSNKKRCYCGPRECVHPSTLLPDYYCAVQCDAPVAPRPPERTPALSPAVSREAEGAQTEGLRDQKFTARMLDAAKFLALAVSPCGSDGEHSWRECPRCLAEHELEARGEGFWNGKPRQPSKAVELLRELAEVVPKLLAAPTVAQAPQDESELDRLVVAYKHIADNDGEHRIKDLVWLINELIYERDQRKAK